MDVEFCVDGAEGCEVESPDPLPRTLTVKEYTEERSPLKPVLG
jgi:hypothetical protein